MHRDRFIPIIVIVVKMSVKQITDRLVRPLADFCDIFLRRRWPVTGVDDKDLSLPNNYGRISAGASVIQILMLDGVDAIRQLGDSSLVGIAQ
jgi:hypothetical protein